MSQLKETDFSTLVDLYIEAKIGKYTTALDILPSEAVELINNLEAYLDEAIAGNR
jgi:hypothetical protein